MSKASPTIAIATLLLFGVVGCFNSEELPDNIDCEYEFVDTFGVKQIHDILCTELCDSLSVWQSQNISDQEMIALTYDKLMVNRLSELSNLDVTTINQGYQDLGITMSSLTTWGWSMENMFSGPKATLYNDIQEMYEVTFDEGEILRELEEIKEEYECQLDPIFVNSVIEVAKSSLVYWNTNYTCIYDASDQRADPCRLRIAWADLWGAGYGAASSGLVGAMFGAIGGTLGAGIGAAITGGCP
ncbi:MAG: hypothetical protein AAGG75_25860 [Bacteroidota bacterium]